MDWGQTYRERGVTAQPHETVARDAGAPPSTQSHGAVEGAPPGSSHAATAQQRPSSSDVWAGALARLQTQVSLNTSMLESHRRQVGEVEEAVGRLQQEFGHVVAVIHEMRAELHARTTLTEQARHDSGDINVLASQVATVTDKANEVDGLKMQLELMKNRMKRFEDHAPPAARPGTSSARELYETAPMSSHSQTPVHAQHLPPMRNVSTYGPPADRSYGGPAPNVLPSQSHPSYQPRPDLRIPSNDQLPIQPAQAYAYRPADPLPPPSAPTGWRSADTHGPPQPQQQLETPVPFRPHASGQKHQPSGWAAVNANAAIKRPFEEHRQSPYGPPSAPGSPKRPRLAPIMPRSGHAEESYASKSSSMQQHGMLAPPDGPMQSRSRAPSNSSQMQPHMLPTPASANASSYRFITSTAEVDMQGGWKVEPESTEHVMPLPSPAGKGRGRGSRRRGGGRGRGSRRGAHHQLPASQEPSVTALQTADLTSTQVQPNDEEPPMAPTGDKPVPRPETSPTNPVDDFPATPILGRHHDTLGATQANPLLLSNSSKKSRSKPTRNADGVLIRKDGRPDMRSVSSANNLRRVHAQREAARGGEGEGEGEGRTPESGWEGSVGGEEGERGEGEVVMKEEDEEEGMDDEGRREGREAEGELSAARGLSDENGVREFRGGDARTAEQQRAGSTDVKMESAPVLSDREPAAVSGSEVQRETASEQSSEQSASLSAERSVASME
ncbi:hypothetical protein LTR91_004238 [Friedmanniomyces endolithicus]|uniref:Uncharacterized protein n=1 Tax=Friedmanniomyces endolithicus TaxID=329885 RepID=A0AAN6KUZ3_9PEZI|nr:hypothetical protein LTR75_004107 [Friedmanniomyces endolithicus]KAK0925046.1 hypothetical protein LTR57_005343 [Friedmanniomyces endolithicus]KAK1004743.1 hypothetical protein LTR91_004238 [Friedmanniomyces endolithicus]KAK1024667.1 hypothetical protein LTS16_023860 [Friedmanniomyces endolithicus]